MIIFRINFLPLSSWNREIYFIFTYWALASHQSQLLVSIVCRFFCVSIYTIMSSVNNDNYNPFTLFKKLLPIALSRTSNTMLNKTNSSKHTCLTSNSWRTMFNISSLNVMFAIGYLYIPFVWLKILSFILNFLRNYNYYYYYWYMLNYIRLYFYSYWGNWTIFLYFVLLWIILIDFWMPNEYHINRSIVTMQYPFNTSQNLIC